MTMTPEKKGSAAVATAIAAWYSVHFLSTSLSGSFLKIDDYDRSSATTLLTVAALFSAAAIYVFMALIQFIRRRRIQGPSTQVFIASAFHLCAVYLVFVSMAQTSVWLTYSIKGLEPLFVLVLRVACSEGQEFGSSNILSLVALGVGTGLTVYRPDKALSGSIVPGIAAAVVSNLACAMRSILSRKLITDPRENRTPIGLFLELSFWASVMYVPYIALCLSSGFPIVGEVNLTPVDAFHVVMVGVTHCIYYMSSYVVLKHVPVVKHSILNVLKRIATVMVGITLLGENYRPINILGSMVANIAAYVIYCDHRNNDQHDSSASEKKGWSSRASLLVKSLLSIVCLFSMFSSLNMVGAGYTMYKIDFPVGLEPGADVTAMARALNTVRRQQCIQDTSDRFLHITQELIGGPRKVAIIDIPAHANLGDSLIAVGELRMLLRAGYEVAYICKHKNGWSDFKKKGSYIPPCNATEAADAIGPDGVAFYHGGGNWGDTWVSVHRDRALLIDELIDAGVKNLIGFPQSLYYKPENRSAGMAADAARLKEWATKGLNVSLMWRQQDSFEQASQYFKDTRNVLTPDAAWSILPLHPSRSAQFDVILLIRIDHEGTIDAKTAQAEAEKLFAESGVSYIFADWYSFKVIDTQPTFSGQHGFHFSETMLSAAISLMSLGKVVVTNRLHATVLATLLGKPAFYLDNMYGKIAATRAVSLVGPTCDSDALQAYGFPDISAAVKAAISHVESHRY